MREKLNRNQPMECVDVRHHSTKSEFRLMTHKEEVWGTEAEGWCLCISSHLGLSPSKYMTVFYIHERKRGALLHKNSPP